MYERHFGLDTKPFAITPDPAFLYPSRQHARALTMLEYGLASHAAFALLTGEIGSGKTTLVRRVLRDLGDDVAVGYLTHTHAGFRSLHRWVLSAFAIVPADDSEVATYEALVDTFVRTYAGGRRTVLIVDEAQNLSIELLEELRLLSNVNSEKDLVLQIVLVGQPELRAVLGRPEMRQFAQRIGVDCHLGTLCAAETSAYVRHRLVAAGGAPDLFDTEALEHVHALSGGVPRLINQLCDTALVYAYAAGARAIGADIVAEILRDRASAGALPVYAPSVAVAASGASATA